MLTKMIKLLPWARKAPPTLPADDAKPPAPDLPTLDEAQKREIEAGARLEILDKRLEVVQHRINDNP